MDPLLRAQAVAQLLDVRPATVYALVDRGVLPHVRLTKGRRRSLIRFRLSEIEAFLEERSSCERKRR